MSAACTTHHTEKYLQGSSALGLLRKTQVDGFPKKPCGRMGTTENLCILVARTSHGSTGRRGGQAVDTPATPDSPLFSFSESLKTKNAVGTGPCCVSCRSSMVHARTVEKGGQSHSREDRLSHGLGCRGQGQSISVISAPHPVLDHS